MTNGNDAGAANPSGPPPAQAVCSKDDTSAVAIVGGGAAGLALLLALHKHGQPARVFDAREAGAAARDKRTLALSHGSRQTLEWLGIWPQLKATPIRRIHISQRDGLGRTRLSAEEQGLPALGYVVPAAQVALALEAEANRLGLPISHGHLVEPASVSAADDQVNFRAAGQAFRASLLAVAEGLIADSSDQAVATRDYGQSAVTCDATLASDHEGCAWERFTRHGPVAVLPHGGPRNVAIVFTCSPDQARALQGLSDDEFVSILEGEFSGRLVFSRVEQRHVFPLGLRYRETTIAPRQVWLGNAAQTLHPVAGQGYNLALRDIRDLARTLAGSSDPGNAALLETYARRRQVDRRGTIGFTDSLVRVFSNDDPLLRHLRGAGLLALDLLPPLRRFVARRMIWGGRAW